MAQIVDKKLLVDGYVYLRSRIVKEKIYWDCRLVRTGLCAARAITNNPPAPTDVILLKGPEQSSHSHPPNQEEVEAEKITSRIKRKAAAHPEVPPAQILRVELAGVSDGVLSQLPEREALKKQVRRERRKDLPPNPRSLSELQELPDLYQKTLQGEKFLIFDSRVAEDEDEDEDVQRDEETAADRTLVFGTRQNLEVLCRSSTWFIDGTFKVTPTLFTQLFTILGVRKRETQGGEGVPLPCIYALMTSKRQDEYSKVLRAVKEAVDEYRIANCNPIRLMCDFELSIINAAKEVFPGIPVNCCLFHLGQSLYRKVQETGLQVEYNDPEDRSIKEFCHMLLALAFVPVADVVDVFTILHDEAPDELLEVIDYFSLYYVNGKPRRGRRAAVKPRYPPDLWNQYQAALTDTHRTNNASEGWHNRFRLLLGKHHPDMYTFLRELQKEQADTEVSLAELSLGRKVKAAPKQKWLQVQERIHSIVAEYDDYKRGDRILDYLRTIGYNINLS